MIPAQGYRRWTNARPSERARSLGQETAAGEGGVREFVVQRIVEGKELAQRGRERVLHRGRRRSFFYR